jgi:hypothetical protein
MLVILIVSRPPSKVVCLLMTLMVPPMEFWPNTVPWGPRNTST